MSSRDPRDDDLEERLDELEDVLSELRADLRETERDRRGPPRPPRLSELVRFTEQYTIPTLIALLETTIKSLELLQGTLRLADPGRSVAEGAGEASDRLADVRDGASAGLSRSLSELRTALSEADLPEEAASRSIIADARDLTAEIEARIDEGRREADAARDRRTGRDRSRDRDDGGRDETDRRADDDESPVRIDVTEPGEGDEREPSGSETATDSDAPEVDVESELESIKRQMDETRAAAAADDAAADEDAGTDDDSAADDANTGDEADPSGDAGDESPDEPAN
ncbi:DUF7547 family protein [Halorubrum tebenquichense]|uniref:Uncharacterized protein n=1 Tax=Halorubrum tebenquichense DSM 14210 TaxID=1227485 RepID=M0DEB4_9EURY|nr:hypothetical protein [Halorubrum tebenquichense]ELZ33846.1 hypothetical protein C472_13517 [Halorubrum tebenquichense DSM 14210]